MSTAGPRLAPSPSAAATRKGRSPLAHLLHALNQPVTGLQCSLELAVAGPRRTEEYVGTLRNALELTGRIRVLVEAIRELSDAARPNSDQVEIFSLDDLLVTTVEDLRPVAETRGIRIQFSGDARLPVRTHRHHLASVLFRLLESALALAADGSRIEIAAAHEAGTSRVTLSWRTAAAPEHSPFSRPELGLLVAQSALESTGAECELSNREGQQICVLRMPACHNPLNGTQFRNGDLA